MVSKNLSGIKDLTGLPLPILGLPFSISYLADKIITSNLLNYISAIFSPVALTFLIVPFYCQIH